MKSYNDKRIIVSLLFLGIAGGFAGRFLEQQHISFPSTGNLNQAAAILATEANIVGTPAPEPEPTISLGLGTTKDADVSFSRMNDCHSEMAIKAAKKRTIGFLCLSVTDENLDIRIAEAGAKANILTVSFDTHDESVARQILDIGASVVTMKDKETVWLYTAEETTHGSSFKLNLTGQKTSDLVVVKK